MSEFFDVQNIMKTVFKAACDICQVNLRAITFKKYFLGLQ